MTGPIRLEFTTDEIDERTLNARDHWSAANAQAAIVHLVVAQRVRRLHARIRLELVDIEVVRVQPTNHRRDPDNLAATTKPIIDGLVQSGLIPDDGHAHVNAVTQRVVVDRGGPPRWVVVVTPRTEKDPCP